MREQGNFAAQEVRHSNILRRLLDAGDFDQYYTKLEQFEQLERASASQVKRLIDYAGSKFDIPQSSFTVRIN